MEDMFKDIYLDVYIVENIFYILMLIRGKTYEKINAIDKDSLVEFIYKFKENCENKKEILDLFSRAELD